MDVVTRGTVPLMRDHTSMTLTARNPEDLIAMVPVVLGFVPHDSVVMLTFGADRSFHARVDLPADPDDLPELVPVLLGPARQHRVRRVVLLAYTADPDLGERVTGTLRDAFEAGGIVVIGRMACDGRRWWSLPRERPDEPGMPYDVSAHPFAAEAVLHGLVTLTSRQELAATLGSDPESVAEVGAALGADPPPPGKDQRTAEATWAAALVDRCVADGSRPDAETVARLLAGMRDLAVRDAAWLTMTRADATAHLELWRDIVCRTPTPWLAAPATILGFAAWLAGQGALAWCAVDRAREADPEYDLATTLAEILNAAMPPSTWDTTSAEPSPGRPA